MLTASDPIVNLALLTGQIAVLATLALLLYTIRLRWALLRRRRRYAAFVQVWRPLIAEVALGPTEALPPSLPSLQRRDLRFFLHEWNIVHDYLIGGAKRRLNALAGHYDLRAYAWRLLRRRTLPSKLIATTTLGHLQDASAWQRLVAQLDSRNTLLSLLSAAALVNIDATRAVPLLIPYILDRDDWPPGRVAALLGEAGTETVSEPLQQAILAAPADRVERLLGFLDNVRHAVASNIIHELLRRSDDVRIITACLRVLDSPEEMEHVRAFTKHPIWHIRMLAATALGRIGGDDEVLLLIDLLADPEWWVRYRAAQALVDLPFMGPNQLRRIRRLQRDRFARDILEQALAERGLA